ncbi:MAG: hypothetical protein NZ930_03470 [Candidatus Bipolaricaulota bacterium]|nr:hypothetical protein [Candidatus Bipolaricaulota bacterium]MDW8031487.1 hypothetical protein [Candidatus Bipolaricaulota bacterium]
MRASLCPSEKTAIKNGNSPAAVGLPKIEPVLGESCKFTSRRERLVRSPTVTPGFLDEAHAHGECALELSGER